MYATQLGQVNVYGESPAEAFARLAREREIRERAHGVTAERAIAQLAAEERARRAPATALAPITTTARPGFLAYAIPAALLYAAIS